MFIDLLLTAFSLAFILLACFLFTNAIEWFGKTLNLDEGVVGSILAAIGTALPETIIPIIAICIYHDEKSIEIGIGAIAGAPFMLATLAFFVTGVSVILYTAAGRRTIKMNADVRVIGRDLTFFFIIYSIAVLTTFISEFPVLKNGIAVVLLLSYAFYVKRSFSGAAGEWGNLDPLIFSRIFKAKTNLVWILAQLILSLAGIIFGAHLFVQYVEKLSVLFGVSALILSIIITPIATELPEKLNSVIWTGKGKDTLAMGNITGAMVFQSCFPVVIGMLFTSWKLTGITLISAALALFSAGFNLAWIKITKSVNPVVLLTGGLLYAVFLFCIFR